MTAMAALALVRAQRLARVADIACAMSLEALQGTPTSFHPAIHAARPLPGQTRERRDAPRAARRLGDRRVASLVRQGAGRLLAALRAAGARREPRSPRLRRAHRRGRAQRRHRQPARPPRGRADRLERQLPRPAGRDRARLPRDRVRRAREHQRAPDRAARQPEPLRRPAAVPRRPRGRAQLRLHDPAVRRGGARLREQGALPSRRRSTRSPRAPVRRITSRWGTAAGLKALQVVANAERVLAIELLAGAQARRVPRAARAGCRRCARRARSSARCPSALREDRSLSADIERVAAAIRDGRLLVAAVGRRGRQVLAVSDLPPLRQPVPRHGDPPRGARRRDPRRRARSPAATSRGPLASPPGTSSSRLGGAGSASAARATCLAGRHAEGTDRRTAARRAGTATRERRLVERLVGDLSAIRAPRGIDAERALVADRGAAPDAAEQPRPRGRRASRGRSSSTAARDARPARTTRCARSCATLLRLGDDETLLVQSGKPVGVFRTHAGAPRVLIANSLLVPALGDVGRVPAARGEGLTMFGQMTAGLVDLHRHAGDPAGHVPDVLRRGRGALRLARPLAGGRSSPPGSGGWAGRSRSRRRWRAPRSSASRSTSARSTAGSRRATSTSRRRRSTTRSRGCARPPRSGGRSRSALRANAADVFPELVAPRRGASTSSPTRRRRTIR